MSELMPENKLAVTKPQPGAVTKAKRRKKTAVLNPSATAEQVAVPATVDNSLAQVAKTAANTQIAQAAQAYAEAMQSGVPLLATFMAETNGLIADSFADAFGEAGNDYLTETTEEG